MVNNRTKQQEHQTKDTKKIQTHAQKLLTN